MATNKSVSSDYIITANNGLGTISLVGQVSVGNIAVANLQAGNATIIGNTTSNNITISNIATIANLQANAITANISTTIGNAIANNFVAVANIYGNIATPAQPMIDEVGTLVDLTIAGPLLGNTATFVSLQTTANATFGGNVDIDGSLNVLGNITQRDIETLEITDPIIILATNNVTNLVDIGFIGQFELTSTPQFGGLIRNHSDNTWNLFSNVTTAPTTGIVDFTDAIYDTLKAGNINLTGNAAIAGNVGANNLTVTRFVNTNLIPNANVTLSLGNSTNQWDSLSILDITASGNISANLGTISSNAVIGNVYLWGNGASLVSNTGNFTGNNISTVGNISATSPGVGTTGAIIVKDAPGNPDAAYLQYVDNTDVTQYGYVRGLAAGGLTFGNSTEFARFTNSGNFGIGTSVPATTLSVAAQAGDSVISVGNVGVSGNHRINVFGAGVGQNYGYYLNSNPALVSNTSTNQILQIGSDGTSATFTQQSFYTNGTQRLTIISNGNVGINTSTPAYTLDVNGTTNTTNLIATSTVNFSTANQQVNSLGIGTPASGTTGEIRATNNITGFYSSDRQFKENVQNIPDAVDKVIAIGGKTFDWTDKYITEHGGEDDYFVKKNDFGVIAQDVQAVFPQAVRTRNDGSLAVDYAKLSALAFAAIAELKQEIDALKGKQ